MPMMALVLKALAMSTYRSDPTLSITGEQISRDLTMRCAGLSSWNSRNTRVGVGRLAHV